MDRSVARLYTGILVNGGKLEESFNGGYYLRLPKYYLVTGRFKVGNNQIKVIFSPGAYTAIFGEVAANVIKCQR